ncbi:MAG: glycosyltransferase, partial [Cyanobacteria bacterium J06639_1]
MGDRLLFLTERFPPDIGGVAASAGRIARSLSGMAFEIDVLVWTRYLQPGEIQQGDRDAVAKGMRLFRLGRYRHWDMTMQRTLTLLNGMHAQHPSRAVWGHYLSPAGFLAVWFGLSANVPSVVSARGNDIDLGAFPPGDFARLQWTLQRATAIAAVSQDMADKIRAICDRRDVEITKNAVDGETFAPTLALSERQALRQQLGIAPDEVVLGFSGELREKKGQDYLFQALSVVRRERPACLLVIGDVRQTRGQRLATFAQSHPDDAARVVVTGHLPEAIAVAQHLQLCDYFLMPSLWDGLPNALLEAMACQLCCIVSDAGGIPEVLTSGKEGFMLPVARVHRFGDAVLECMQLTPDRRQQLGEAARLRVLT